MKFTVASSVVLSAVFLFPLMASAHEHQTFLIGDKAYSFIVGSLNEPVTVDDKSGVELEVMQVPASEEAEHDEDDHGGKPVEGLQQTLKVEVSAGDRKKVFDLSPIFGAPGSYKAVFFPTVQTTLTYRFFGTINSVPVDLSFTCNPAGHPVTENDTADVEVSENVTRLEKSGAFGCPIAKADMGFPEPSATLYDLASVESDDGNESMDLGLAGLVAGLLGLAVGVAAYRKK